MNKEITTKREVPKFTLEQKAYLESFFSELAEKLEGIQSALKVTNESLVDGQGEQNKNITILDVHKSLSLLNDAIDPINTELFELSSGADYLLWDLKDKNKINFWEKIEDAYPASLESVKKREGFKAELKKVS